MRPGLYELAPLPWRLGESPHPKLVQRAPIEGGHILRGFVAIVCVHPRVQAALAHWLVLNAVFHNASIGVLGGLPAKPNCIDGQGICMNVPWGRRAWRETIHNFAFSI